MTLVINEIHIMSGLDDTFIIAGADRKIIDREGKPQHWKKLFEIPYLHGAISYYGLAEFKPIGKNSYVRFSEWLPSFIRNNSSLDNLCDFSYLLQRELNSIVPAAFLRNYASGFHICGFDTNGFPDFWSLSNIGELSNFHYSKLQKKYQFPANDLRKTNLSNIDWENGDTTIKNRHIFYRNGDFRAHSVTFSYIDEIYKYLSQFDDFIQISERTDYRDYVKMKFEILSYIYKKMTKKKIIGRPIDVILLEKPDIRKR